VTEGIATAQGGRVFNTAGDGFILEFGSSLAAVEAALESDHAANVDPISCGARHLLADSPRASSSRSRMIPYKMVPSQRHGPAIGDSGSSIPRHPELAGRLNTIQRL
jgi:hypothetical protein